MNEGLQKILDKKELKGIPAEFLGKYVEEYKNKHAKTYSVLQEKSFNEKSKEFDHFKKFIRKKLREIHGVFSKESIGTMQRKKLLDEINQGEDPQATINKILISHQSTFERINNYDELYRKIFRELLGSDAVKVVDLGCGYNPFSLSIMKKYSSKIAEYTAVDINREDAEFINCFFQKKRIKGKALTIDLTSNDSLPTIEKETENADVCLAFKLLDSLESKKRGSAALLIQSIKSKLIIVSFPTKTISGKSEISGKRRWFDKIVEQNAFEKEEFLVGNEKYYALKRSNS